MTLIKSPRQHIQVSLEEETKLALKKLQEDLHLDRLPERVEGYDISNIQGKQADGKPLTDTLKDEQILSLIKELEDSSIDFISSLCLDSLLSAIDFMVLIMD